MRKEIGEEERILMDMCSDGINEIIDNNSKTKVGGYVLIIMHENGAVETLCMSPYDEVRVVFADLLAPLESMLKRALRPLVLK